MYLQAIILLAIFVNGFITLVGGCAWAAVSNQETSSIKLTEPAIEEQPSSEKLCFRFAKLEDLPRETFQEAKILNDGLKKKDHDSIPDLLTSHGNLKNREDIHWAAVKATVPLTPSQVVNALIDHNTTKSPKVKEMSVETIVQKGLEQIHKVHFVLKPFPFITVDWDEIWGYLKLPSSGSAESYIVSYQKIAGTSHIKHLCGNATIIGHNTGSSVLLYEEANATRRSVEDTENGLIGTIQSIIKFQRSTP